MLDAVTTAFQKVVLVLNIGSIMDFAEIDAYGDKISAVLLAWQLGMESGNAVADVLTGQVNPSGRLTDTIAKTYADYPAQNFGNKAENRYTEDILWAIGTLRPLRRSGCCTPLVTVCLTRTLPVR